MGNSDGYNGAEFQFALPRGERRIQRPCPNLGEHGFNSRSRVGSDRLAVNPRLIYHSFNSRSRVGSDTGNGYHPGQSASFNSRSRVGSDNMTISIRITPFAFQFALPRGERRGRRCIPASARRFQFALPRGERPTRAHRKSCPHGFQFALPRGERRCFRFGLGLHNGSFNSRSRVGSDPNPAPFPPPGWGFNSRSRVGSDTWCATVASPSAGFNSRSRVGSDHASP